MMNAAPRRPIRAAVTVTARTVPPVVAALAGLAALPAVVARARGGHELTMAVSVAALLAGAGAGFAADDQAANVLAPSPTILLTRRALRAVVVALVLLAGFCTALVLAVTAGGPPVALGGPLSVLGAAAAIACALASGKPDDGSLAPGLSSAFGSVLALLTVSALAERWPAFPTIARSGFDRRWVALVVAGTAVALVRSRDPAGSRLRRLLGG